MLLLFLRLAPLKLRLNFCEFSAARLRFCFCRCCDPGCTFNPPLRATRLPYLSRSFSIPIDSCIVLLFASFRVGISLDGLVIFVDDIWIAAFVDSFVSGAKRVVVLCVKSGFLNGRVSGCASV